MMQLIFLLALVLAFTSLLNANGRPVAAADVKLAWTLLACGSLTAFAWWIGQLKYHLDPASLGRWSRSIRCVERLHGVAYLAVMLMVFVIFDFAEIMHSNWRLGRFLLADDIAVSIPLTIPLLISWFWLSRPRLTADGRDSRAHRNRDVWLLARHLVVLPMIPVLMITGIADVQRLYASPQSDSARAVLAGLAVVVIALTLPVLLRWCWPTRPLEPGPTRSLIEATLAEAGVSVRQILHWETHGQLANAAMAGLLPRLRYLFVTDELLRRLTPTDLQVITAHEAAHCRFGHLPRLATSLAIPFLALLLGDPLRSAIGWSDPASLPLLVVTVLGLWSLWHGRWAQLLEHEADLAACRLLCGGQPRLGAPAVEAFARALLATGARGDWLHPSPEARITLLHRLAAVPEAEEGFQRRVRMAARGQWLIIGLLAGAWLYAAS